MWSADVFAGKKVIVTGGGTGIGRTTALLFAELGADVAVAARNHERVEAVAKEVAAMGRNAMARRLDIREPDRIQEFVEEVVGEFGGVDFLINNAGGQFPQRAEELTPRGWQAVVNTNLNGTFYMSQAVGKAMIERQAGGRIVNMAANFVFRGAPGIAHTAAARAGVVTMAQTLALEWARYDILVNSIGIGVVVTEGATNEMLTVPESEQRLLQRMPLHRFGKADDVANLAVYLCSPGGDYITGQTIMVDGGNCIGDGVRFFDI